MKSIFKTLIEFAFGLHLNLDLKTKNRKGILLEKNFFSSLFGPTSEPAQQPLFPPSRARPALLAQLVDLPPFLFPAARSHRPSWRPAQLSAAALRAYACIR